MIADLCLSFLCLLEPFGKGRVRLAALDSELSQPFLLLGAGEGAVYFYLPLGAEFHAFIWLAIFAPLRGSSGRTWLYPALRHACRDSCGASGHPLLFHLLGRFGDGAGRRTRAAVVPDG